MTALSWIGVLALAYLAFRFGGWLRDRLLWNAYTHGVMQGREFPPWEDEEAKARARVRLTALIDEEQARITVHRGPWDRENER